jgi:hypothetical protein
MGSMRENAYWDTKVEEWCQKDGGITIFEAIELPTAEYERHLQGGELWLPRTLGPEAKRSDPLYGRSTISVLKTGNPEVYRSSLSVVRGSDHKVLATRVTYTRGFLRTRRSDSQIYQYECPKVPDEVFFSQVIKERGDHETPALRRHASPALPRTVPDNERRMSFDNYCRTAGLSIAERLSGSQRVLIDRSAVTHSVYQRRGVFSFFDLVRAKNVAYFDEKTTTGTRYRRHRKSLNFEVVRETDANILLKFETLTSNADHEDDLFGEQMTISDRVSGRLIATYRYFWKSPLIEDYCPKNRANAPHPDAVAAYVFGLDRGQDTYYERQYLPVPQ